MARKICAGRYRSVRVTDYPSGLVRHPEAPTALQGIWTPFGEACDTSNQSRFSVSPKVYATSQFECHIDWVTETAGAEGPAYAAHLRCSNGKEPTQSKPSNILMVPKGKQEMLAGAGFGSLKNYQRCQ